MKVIFLDVDGVLNTIETFIRKHELMKNEGIRVPEIDRVRVSKLSKIVKETNSELVLSSSWRHGFIYFNDVLIPRDEEAASLVDIFEEFDLKLYDKTGFDSYANRSTEILDWLSNHPGVINFLILDDMIFYEKTLKDHAIKTYFSGFNELGLTDEHVDRGIKILNDEKILKR